MTDPTTGPGPEAEPEEPFMSRWSRLKSRARETAATEAESSAAPPPAEEADAQPVAAKAPPELPDINLLGEDSDFSAFLADGVDTTLRRKALRKLFHSPKFNVLDDLDDFRGDFSQFEPLGSIVTADMRYQIERAARLAEQALAEIGEEPVSADRSAAAPEAVEAPRGNDPSDHETENHDEPDRNA